MDEIGFECVQPTENHAFLIMNWRNDPQTLQMSYHSRPKVWDPFFKEFKEEYFSLPNLPPLFILHNGVRVGFVRFKLINHPEGLLNRQCAEISINIAREYRGQGIGKFALKALNDWAIKQGIDDLYAEVKEENNTSQKMFLSSGYKELKKIKKTIDSGETFSIHPYLNNLSEKNSSQQKVLIIAEAGSNWRMGTPSRDISMAKTLIDAAVEARADVIKFQVFRPHTIYAPGAGKSDYLEDAGIHEEIEDIFADLAMPYEMIPELKMYAQQQGIEWMATTFSPEDFAAVDPFVRRHKVASYEIGHLRLLELIGKSQKPVILSTGAATEEEISWAVETLKINGCQDLTLLQCTAKYPAEPKSLHLRTIPWLKSRFKVPTGLSDHSQHPLQAPIAAVALGATVIEKHFTLDRRLPGPDHAFAITAEELKEMVHAIRQTELMLGASVKLIDPSEQELRTFCKRGIQALQDISQGDVLEEGHNIDVLRPGKCVAGVHAKHLPEINGQLSTRFILKGQGIQHGDWEKR